MSLSSGYEPSWPRDGGIHARPSPAQPKRSHREGSSWKIGDDLVDLIAAQSRGVGTQSQDGQPSHINDDRPFVRLPFSRSEENASRFDGDIEHIPFVQSEFSTQWPRQNDLPLGRKPGFHDKNIISQIRKITLRNGTSDSSAICWQAGDREVRGPFISLARPPAQQLSYNDQIGAAGNTSRGVNVETVIRLLLKRAIGSPATCEQAAAEMHRLAQQHGATNGNLES